MSYNEAKQTNWMTRLKFDHFAASEKHNLLFKMEAILE